MTSEFPRSPRLLKGSLVVFETKLPVPTNMIVFQYNPDAMTRNFQQQTGPQNAWFSAGDSAHVTGPPTETFQITVELDAADQLEAPRSNPLTVASGLHPALSALELLLYPPSTMLILNKVLAFAGSAMVTPPEVPLVLFVWGPARVVPVRITAVSITEQAFDQRLNPILAKVELGMRSLTEKELKQAGAPFDTLALVRQITKEALARANVANAAQQIRGILPF